ncbi:MAG: PKD domain-containing protein [Bacteroidia bacterium]
MTKGSKQKILTLAGAVLCSLYSFCQNPSAGFTVNQNSGCSPLTVQYTNTSTGATTYFWDFGNGNTSVLTNPTNVYSNPGSYTVKLFATSANGYTDSLISSNIINVSANSVPDFQVQNPTVCLNGNSVPFVNTSTYASSYLWDFGDGITSALQNPVHSYVSPGTYTVKLVTYDNYGCPSIITKSNYIQVKPSPVAEFSVNTNTGCDPAQVFNFNTATAASGYSWDFGDGTSSTQQNPSHTYSNSGTYNVSLTATSSQGCSHTSISYGYINVETPFTPTFTSTTNGGCIPVEATFQNQSAFAVDFLWNFGDGSTSTDENPVHIYTNSGNYTVSLTTTSYTGCSYTTSINNHIIVGNNPVANFSTSNPGSCPANVLFTNLSANAASQLWEFGDGYTSTLPNPTHKYNEAGSFNVLLHVYNSSGCESVKLVTNAVNLVIPVANFVTSYTPGCAPLTAGFSNTSQNAVQWLWTFGDGSTSTLKNPSHTYNLPGSYNVGLIATDAQGCSDTVVFNSAVQVINTAGNFVTPPAVNGCAPFNTTFSNLSPDATSWLWNFGDGSTSALQNPSHTYTTAGTYTVSLTVHLSSGCTQHYPSFRIFNINSAQAAFTQSAQEICASTSVNFNGSSSGTLASSLWDFGDGSISTQQNPVHTYVIPGFYSVKYTATTTNGCFSSIIKTNCLHASSCSSGSGGNNTSGGSSTTGENTSSPSPSIASFTGCVPFAVNFNNTVPSTVSWLWNFGDGSTSNLQNPLHTYTTPGNYTVTLTAQTSSGTTETVVYTNYINATGANADFTMTENGNCQNSSVTLSSSSTSNVSSWHWDFGDGYTSSAQNPTHAYTDPTNNYIVTLTTTTAQGCSGSVSKSLLLSASAPVIWASDYEICMNQTVNFSSMSGNYTSYLWDFGDGFSSTLSNPTHFFQGNGLFNVTLQTTDNKGCTRTVALQPGISVTKPNPGFNYALVNGCTSKTVDFTNTSTGTGNPVAASCKWNFGDGTPEQWAEHPTHIYSAQGTYVVTLTVYNNGCSNSITKTIYVNQVTADFSFVQNTTCLPSTANFTDASSPAVSWLWHFGDGTTSTLQNPSHTYTVEPQDGITLTVTSSNGCQASVTKQGPTLFNTNFGLSVGEGCSPLFVEFYDGSTSANQWLWDFGDGSSSTLQNPSHTYTTDGTFTVKLVSKSAAGCTDTALFLSIATNKPQADFSSSSSSTCSPALVNFTDLSLNAVSWLWDFGDGSTSVNQNPGHVYNIPGPYTVSLITTNVFGCSDTLVKTNYIQVPGSHASFAISASQACAESPVAFTDQSINAISWSWNFGDGNTSTQKNPGNTYLNPGQYTVSLLVHNANGCTSSFTLPNPIIINPSPVANYSVSDTAACTPFPVAFNNLSQNAVSYSWNFGDGAGSNAPNPLHTYTVFGTYYTSLTATNQFGCSAVKAFGPVRAKKTPTADFTSGTTSGCSPLLASFLNNSTNTGTSTYLWNFGSAGTSTLQNPSVTFTNPGFYNISLIVANNNGCKDTIAKPNILQVYDMIPPPAPGLRVVTVTSDTTVQITWNQSDAEDFAAYKIYRKDNATGTYTAIATVNNPSQSSFTDGGRNTLSSSYCYKVQTTDICGYAQPLDSLEEHCTINISAQGINDDILLSWSAYIGAQPETYSLYRLEANQSGAVLVGTVPGNVLTLTDTTLNCPNFYSYRVKANKLNGQAAISSNSDTCIAKPVNNVLVQQKVDVVRSTVIDNSKVLTEWKAPAIAPEKVAGYAIYRSTDKNNFSLLANVSAAARDYIDEAVDVNAQNYYYKIKVLNFCDIVSRESNNSSSILLKAELIDGNVNLKWTGYDGWNMGVDYYIIEKQNENGEWEQIKKVDGNTLQHEETE